MEDWGFSHDGADGLRPCVLAEIVDSDRGFARGPERTLLSALLFDAIQTYMNFAAATGRAQRDAYNEAERWIHREGDESIFSFESVCEGLGINPDYLRYGLANAFNGASKEWKRGRRK